MGNFDFDPDRWLEERGRALDPAKAAKAAKADEEADGGSFATFATFADHPSERHGDLLDTLAIIDAGLDKLQRRLAPRLARPREWSNTIADAVRLRDDGWVEQALAVGWTLVDLYGVGPEDSWQFSGLAVWLDGRSLLMLDDRRAVARDGARTAYFTRGGFGHGEDTDTEPVLLWDFGR